MVQPVYQTTALININKEEEKHQAIVMQQYQGYEYDENPMSAEIMLLLRMISGEGGAQFELDIQYLEKDTFKVQSQKMCLLSLSQQFLMIP
jgi:hypothetical protein